MPTKGFVLVFCLLFGLLISALALAALVLSELSGKFNQAGLTQKQQSLLADTTLPQLSGASGTALQLSLCPAQFQVWPAQWQQCQLRRAEQADLNRNGAGQIELIWQVDPHTHGGEL